MIRLAAPVQISITLIVARLRRMRTSPEGRGRIAHRCAIRVRGSAQRDGLTPLTRNVRARRAHSDLSPAGRGGSAGSISAKHAVILALLVCCAPAPQAHAAGAENDDSRYTFTRVDEGYLRLDGRTGQVSLCTRRAVGWACQAVPDERAALEGEIARLQGENSALKKELLAHDLPLPGVVPPQPPAAKPQEPSLQLPDASDLNKLMSFIENVWRRLVEMITTLQKDMLRKT